jgi:DNA-binding MarR family transcriptional regulator
VCFPFLAGFFIFAGKLPFGEECMMIAQAMPGHLIRRMQQMATQQFAIRMREAGFDITPVQFAALDAIQARPGIDQAGLAALIAYDRATIGGVVDRLVAKGLVSREVSSTDRRAREVRLTDTGKVLYQQLVAHVELVQDDILSGLPPPEREQFMTLARKLLANER